MKCRRISIPHGAAGTFTGWYTICRGPLVTRAMAIRILIFGATHIRMDTVQTKDPMELPL